MISAIPTRKLELLAHSDRPRDGKSWLGIGSRNSAVVLLLTPRPLLRCCAARPVSLNFRAAAPDRFDAACGQCLTIQTVRQKSPPTGDGGHGPWVALGVGSAAVYVEQRCGVAGLRDGGCATPDPPSDVWRQALQPQSSRRSRLSPFGLVWDLSPQTFLAAFAIASSPRPFAQKIAAAQH